MEVGVTYKGVQLWWKTTPALAKFLAATNATKGGDDLQAARTLSNVIWILETFKEENPDFDPNEGFFELSTERKKNGT